MIVSLKSELGKYLSNCYCHYFLWLKKVTEWGSGPILLIRFDTTLIFSSDCGLIKSGWDLGWAKGETFREGRKLEQASIIDQQDLHRPVNCSPRLLRRPHIAGNPSIRGTLFSLCLKTGNKGKKFIAYCFLSSTLSIGLSFAPSTSQMGICGGAGSYSLNILY